MIKTEKIPKERVIILKMALRQLVSVCLSLKTNDIKAITFRYTLIIVNKLKSDVKLLINKCSNKKVTNFLISKYFNQRRQISHLQW